MEEAKPFEPTFHAEDDNPEYGTLTPTRDDDPDDSDDKPKDTKWVQESLNRLGEHLIIDGIFGAKTKQAVINFQNQHNNKHPDELLKVDGIPGPLTCLKIRVALTAGI